MFITTFFFELHSVRVVVPQIESFKNSKLGSRIRFHFRRNPYFQNNIIMKEVHLGMGGEHHSRGGGGVVVTVYAFFFLGFDYRLIFRLVFN